MCAPSLLPVRKEIKKRKEERPAKKRASCNRLHLLRRSLCRPSDQPATSTKRPFALPSRCARRVCVCVVCMRVFPPRLLDAPSLSLSHGVIHMGRNRLLIVDLAPQLLSDPFGYCPFPLWLRPISALPFSLRHRSADRPFYFYYDFAYYISIALHYSKCD